MSALVEIQVVNVARRVVRQVQIENVTAAECAPIDVCVQAAAHDAEVIAPHAEDDIQRLDALEGDAVLAGPVGDHAMSHAGAGRVVHEGV